MDINYTYLILLSLGGVTAGFMNVLAGGGSMLTIPMMLLMNLPGAVANGTNRIAILAQNITASITFFRSKSSNLKLSITLSLCAIPGAIIGAYYGAQLNGLAFNRVIAIIMLLGLISMLFDNTNYSKPQPVTEPEQCLRNRIGHFLMFFVGIFGGFIQIGVGLILMPLLYKVMRLDLVAVNSHKVFIVMCYTVVSLAIFASTVEIAWILGLALAIGNSIGGWLGAKATIKKGEKLIKTVLYIVLVAFIIRLWFNT